MLSMTQQKRLHYTTHSKTSNSCTEIVQWPMNPSWENVWTKSRTNWDILMLSSTVSEFLTNRIRRGPSILTMFVVALVLLLLRFKLNSVLYTYEKGGVVNSTLIGIDLMRKDKGMLGGTIVNIASITALGPHFWLPVYAGSKHAVLGFTTSLNVTSEKSVLTE